MMNDPLNIVPSELVTHGGNVHTLAGELGATLDTANTTSAADTAGAYGPLCAPIMVPILTAAEEIAKRFMGAAQETYGLNGQAAFGLAEMYTTTDEDGRRRVEQAAEDLSTPEFPGAES